MSFLPEILYSPKSLLAFLTAGSFVAWIGGLAMQGVNQSIGSQIAGGGLTVFIITFGIWVIYIAIALYRNIRSL